MRLPSDIIEGIREKLEAARTNRRENPAYRMIGGPGHRNRRIIFAEDNTPRREDGTPNGPTHCYSYHATKGWRRNRT